MANTPTPETLSRIVRWIVLLVIAYAVLSGALHLGSGKSPSHTAALGGLGQASKEECEPRSRLDDFSLLAPALLPSKVPAVDAHDLEPGSGKNGAVCGQHAAFTFEYALPDGTIVYNGYGKAQERETIGEGKLLRGMELGMIGMKPGGQRRITFPPELGFARVQDPQSLLGGPYGPQMRQLSQSAILGRLSLAALAPPLPAGAQPLRLIDHSFAGGAKAQCGDTVRAELTLWKLDGTKVFSTRDVDKPLVFTLGRSQVPFGVEQSVIGMTQDSERTAIIPAAYTRPLAPAGHAFVPLPQEMLLAEIHLQHIGN